MGLTPTKNAIIGTFINGRNDQNDFLQLATNNGDSVFAWIDAQGILQGAFASIASPGGSNTDVQYNNNGVLGGDNGFTYNSTHGIVKITNNISFDPTRFSQTAAIATAVLPSTTNGIGMQSNVTLVNSGVLSLAYGFDASLALGSVNGGAITTFAGYHTFVNAATGFTHSFATNVIGADIHINTSVSTQTNGIGVNITFEGNADPPNCYGVFVQPMTPVNGAVCWGLYSANTGAYLGGDSALVNPTAATSLVNQNSPKLTFTGQVWGTNPVPASYTNSYSIQVVNGALLFTSNLGQAPVNPYQFDNSVLINSSLTTGSIASVFQTGNAGATYPVTSVANAVGNLTTYNYTSVAGGQPQGPQNITITGFTTSANNGTFVVQSATLTTLTVYNSGGVAETHAATATVQGTYIGNQGQSGFSYANGNPNLAQFPIAGTSFAIPNQFSAIPGTPSFTSIVKGDSVDAGYWRHINDGATGNHGLEIGSIIDSTGAAPVTLQLGVFNGSSSAVLNVPLTVKGAAPTGGTSQLSLGSTTASSASAGANGDVPAQVVGYLIFDLAGTKIKVPYYAS